MNEPASSALPVVLAAGLGTRMKSGKPKVLHELCGRPMLAYVLDAAERACGARPLVVYSPPTSAIVEAFGGRADFALQQTPLGTADAVKAALAVAPPEAAELLVLSGDVPLVDPEMLAELVELRRASEAAVALVAVATLEPEGLGRVVRDVDGGEVLRIVEQKDAAPEELELDEINAGLYAFDAAWLRSRIEDVAASPVSGEFYLPALVELAHADGRPVVSLDVADDGTLTGINDRSQLAEAEFAMRVSINEAHMKAGVTMLDPSTAYVDAGVELGTDVTLEPNVSLRGRTRVGDGTLIGSGSVITDGTVGRNCVVRASLIEGSEIADGSRVGPFADLRPGASGGGSR
jgi:bifunctional UDP-N-acetylglucosamine pyrophosphorylase/glucosamine-1-phosphate N-acetyltransferase